MFPPVVVIAVPALVAVAAGLAGYHWALAARVRRSLPLLAGDLNFVHVVDGWNPGRLIGEVDGHRVDLRYSYLRGGGDSRATATVISVSGAPLGLTVRPAAGYRGLLGQSMSLTRTGDAAFDQAVFLFDAKGDAQALLTARARQAILAIVSSHGGVLSGGAITFESTSHITDAAQLRALLGQATAAIALLTGHGDLSARLSRIVCEDPLPGVRIQCLRSLEARAPETELLRETARELRSDPDPDVRAAANQVLARLGYEGGVSLPRAASGALSAREDASVGDVSLPSDKRDP